MTTVTSLAADDYDDWLPLWRDYLVFYDIELSTAQTDLTFARLIDPAEAVHGVLGRDEDGVAQGIVHWLTHPSTWSAGPYCYLEDLFVHPRARGNGTGAALIEHVRTWAEQSGCDKLYWLTQRGNRRARALYERVALDTGFVHYEIDLASARLS